MSGPSLYYVPQTSLTESTKVSSQSSRKGRFEKLRAPQGKPEQKNFSQNYYYNFQQSKETAVGQWENDSLVMTCQYLQSPREYVRLHHSRFESQSETSQAQVFIIHGIFENSQRYYDIACNLANKGIVAHLLDLSGFGQSGGTRNTSSSSDLIQDLLIFLQQQDPSLPLFVMGCSFGGSLVLTLLMLNPGLPVRGVILISPMLAMPARVSEPMRAFYRLGRAYFQEFACTLNLNLSVLSRNNFYFKKLLQDKLVSQNYGSKLGYTIMDVIYFLNHHTPKFNKPVLVVNGDLDTLSPHSLTDRFLSRCTSSDKELLLVPNGQHDINADLLGSRLSRRLVHWCLSRSKPAPCPSRSCPQQYTNKVPPYQLNLSRLVSRRLLFFVLSLALLRYLRLGYSRQDYCKVALILLSRAGKSASWLKHRIQSLHP